METLFLLKELEIAKKSGQTTSPEVLQLPTELSEQPNVPLAKESAETLNLTPSEYAIEFGDCDENGHSGTEEAFQSTPVHSVTSLGEFEKAGRKSATSYEGDVDLGEDVILNDELDHLKMIIQSTKRRNRNSLTAELKDLWNDIKDYGKSYSVCSNLSEGFLRSQKEAAPLEGLEFDNNEHVDDDDDDDEDDDSDYETSPVKSVFKCSSYGEFIGFENEVKKANKDTSLVAGETKEWEESSNQDRLTPQTGLITNTFSKSPNINTQLSNSTSSQYAVTSKSAVTSHRSDDSATLSPPAHADKSFERTTNSSESNDTAFSEILADDIMDYYQQVEPESIAKLKEPDKKTEKPPQDNLPSNVTDVQIIQLIVEQLKNELQPTLSQLTRESEKYQIAKRLYKLPSISNLNEHMQVKHKPGAKKFDLEFDESVIQTLINQKRHKLDKQLKRKVLPAKDQVKLDFNKYRRLNTISEDQETSKGNPVEKESDVDDRSSNVELKPTSQGLVNPAERSHMETKSAKGDDILEFVCEKPNYQHSKDHRQLIDLELKELYKMRRLLDEGKLKDISKVKFICRLFEKELCYVNKPISKMPNSVLSSEISKEVLRRDLKR